GERNCTVTWEPRSWSGSSWPAFASPSSRSSCGSSSSRDRRFRGEGFPASAARPASCPTLAEAIHPEQPRVITAVSGRRFAAFPAAVVVPILNPQEELLLLESPHRRGT